MALYTDNIDMELDQLISSFFDELPDAEIGDYDQVQGFGKEVASQTVQSNSFCESSCSLTEQSRYGERTLMSLDEECKETNTLPFPVQEPETKRTIDENLFISNFINEINADAEILNQTQGFGKEVAPQTNSNSFCESEPSFSITEQSGYGERTFISLDEGYWKETNISCPVEEPETNRSVDGQVHQLQNPIPTEKSNIVNAVPVPCGFEDIQPAPVVTRKPPILQHEIQQVDVNNHQDLITFNFEAEVTATPQAQEQTDQPGPGPSQGAQTKRRGRPVGSRNKKNGENSKRPASPIKFEIGGPAPLSTAEANASTPVEQSRNLTNGSLKRRNSSPTAKKLWEIGQELSKELDTSSIEPRIKNAWQARRTRERKETEKKTFEERIKRLSNELDQATREIKSKDDIINDQRKKIKVLENDVFSQKALLSEKFQAEIMQDINGTKNPIQVVVLCPGLLSQGSESQEDQTNSDTLNNSNNPNAEDENFGLVVNCPKSLDQCSNKQK